MSAPRPLWAVLAGVAAVAATVAAAAATAPAAGVASAGPPPTAPVTRADLACPPAVGRADSAAVVAVGVPPGAAGSPVSPADLALLTASGSVAARPAAGRSGVRWTTTVGRDEQPVLRVRAQGPAAGGLTGLTVGRSSDGPDRGLTAGSCVAPSGEAWLVGGGAAPGRRSVLRLVNLDPTPAVVDVTVFGRGGSQRPTGAQGVPVGPGADVALPLDALAPGDPVVVVNVATSAGRVAAFLTDREVQGTTPRGADVVVPGLPPSRSVLVPGVFGDPQVTASLVLLAPGQQDAQVRLELATPQGRFVPVGLDALRVPAGQPLVVPLDQALQGRRAAVVVSSDQPVVAGVDLATRTGLVDRAHLASARPDAGPLFVPWVRSGPGVRTGLLLTAGTAADVTATVRLLPWAGSTPWRTGGAPVATVKVPAGTTVETVLSDLPDSDGTAAVVSTTSQLTAAVVYTEAGQRGFLVAATPLQPVPRAVVVPRVAVDPAAGLPD